MTDKMVQYKDDVVAMLLGHRSQIKAFGVRRLGLFGSFVRSDQNSQSDVDLLVEFEPGGKTFDNFIHLCFLLEELLRRRVELVTPESLSPYIKPHILEQAEYVTIAA
jgi:predicted nucleotidyltransferase